MRPHERTSRPKTLAPITADRRRALRRKEGHGRTASRFQFPAISSSDEQDQAAEHSTPQALVIHEIVREEGEAAMDRTAAALIWSALAAGLSMGFSFLVQSILESALPDTSWRGLVSSFGYTIGFVIVILGRQQLFTESTLTAVLPVLTRRDLKTLLKTLRLWAIVLFFNLVGTVIFAAILQIRRRVFAGGRRVARQGRDDAALRQLRRDRRARDVRGLADRADGVAAAERALGAPADDPADHLHGRREQADARDRGIGRGVVRGDDRRGDVSATTSACFCVPTFIGNMIGGISLVAIVNHAAIAPEITGMPTRQD